MTVTREFLDSILYIDWPMLGDLFLLKHFLFFVPQETNSYTLEIRAKSQHHRFLIGRGGANIKKVRENTGARVVFPTPNDEDKELITIIGKKEGVEAAKQELLKAIKDLV